MSEAIRDILQRECEQAIHAKGCAVKHHKRALSIAIDDLLTRGRIVQPPSGEAGAGMTAKMLAAYQRAFNRIDDLMEYRGMDKPQFVSIAASLRQELSDLVPAQRQEADRG